MSTRGSPRTAPRTCVSCGVVFSPRPTRGSPPLNCSPACKRTRVNQLARARRAELVATRPTEVRLACRECGREFHWPRARRPLPRTCSPECKHVRGLRQHRNKVEIARCMRCGEEFLRQKHGGRRSCEGCLPPPRNRNAPHTCRNCGVEFMPKSVERVTFCSRDCSYAFRRAARIARKEKKQADRRRRAFRECRVCGQVFRAPTLQRRVCSAQCRRRRAADCMFRMRQGVEREEALRPRACKWCGGPFTPRRINSHFCSAGCVKKAWLKTPAGRESKRRRQARWRARTRALLPATGVPRPQGSPA